MLKRWSLVDSQEAVSLCTPSFSNVHVARTPGCCAPVCQDWFLGPPIPPGYSSARTIRL